MFIIHYIQLDVYREKPNVQLDTQKQPSLNGFLFGPFISQGRLNDDDA